MREIDDAHDAEDQIEPKADQREIQAEDQPGQNRADQHGVSGAADLTCR